MPTFKYKLFFFQIIVSFYSKIILCQSPCQNSNILSEVTIPSVVIGTQYVIASERITARSISRSNDTINFVSGGTIELKPGFTISNGSVFTAKISDDICNISIPDYVPFYGLMAWYPFLGNADDRSGNNFDGLINGAQLTNDRFGNTENAFEFFDYEYIEIPNTEEQNYFPITISLWYMPYEIHLNQNANIFSKYYSGSWNGFQILYGDDRNPGNNNDILNGFGTHSWYLKNTEDKLIGYYNPFLSLYQPVVNLNTWYHYVFIAGPDEGKIFLNGELISFKNWEGSSGISTNDFLWKIGGEYNEEINSLNEAYTWFNGKIDDIGIWNRELTNSEIKKLFEANNEYFIKLRHREQFKVSPKFTFSKIYPNPFTSTINIEVDGANSPIDICIYSIQGQLIRTLNKTELNSISLDLSNLESGVYVVKVLGKDFTESRRIVKSY